MATRKKQVTAEEMRSEVMHDLTNPLDEVAALTESPIELLFFWACVGVAGPWKQLVFGPPSSPEYWPGQVAKEWEVCGLMDEDVAGEVMVLGVQPEIRLADGSVVRLDFCLCFSRPRESFVERVCIAVECDGHDFHEKTKEQARRDKKRDRDLQTAGWMVARFSGSELFRDPRGCVSQVLQMAFAKFAETSKGTR